MGTSQSSTGSPPGVPMVPPWVPDVSPPDAQDGDNDVDIQTSLPTDERPALPQPVVVAPRGRFGPSRASLGNYANSGSAYDMRRGLGHYVGKGLGGASTAVRRFGGTARTASALYDALATIASGQAATVDGRLDSTLLAARSANEVMDAVVESIRPVDGTQDAEASRIAIRDALSELLNRFPDADLLRLSEEERLFAIERYVALDINARFRLDVGKSIQDRAPSPLTALSRFREVKDYIKETVSAAFRQMRNVSQQLSAEGIVGIVRQALYDTFRVFEDYVT